MLDTLPMEYENNKASEWLRRLNESDSPLVITLTTHLLIEYGIEYLLSSEGSCRPELNDELLGMSFSRKAKLVFKMGLIPKQLYNNIVNFNKIRNQFAHNLDVDIETLDLNFTDPTGQMLDEISSNHQPPLSTSETRDRLIAWGACTFGWLHNHIHQKRYKSG